MFLNFSGPSSYMYLSVETRLVKKKKPTRSGAAPCRIVQKAKLNTIKNINTAYTNKKTLN